MALLASRTRRRFAIAPWAAFIVEVLRRLLDLQWHLTHAEFETGSDQLQAHLADVALNRGVARFEGHPNTQASGWEGSLIPRSCRYSAERKAES